jgi:fatty-acid desaturase
MYGSRLASQPDESRNSRLMGILTLGDGWHASHHRFPGSAQHGLLPGQFDWTWQVIRALRALGLATDVRVVTSHAVTNMVTSMEVTDDVCR